jgi:hypothetical protein
MNATLVMLARNSDINGVVSSMQSLEDRWNSHYNYPWILLNVRFILSVSSLICSQSFRMNHLQKILKCLNIAARFISNVFTKIKFFLQARQHDDPGESVLWPDSIRTLASVNPIICM